MSEAEKKISVFSTTHWSVVLTAQNGDLAGAATALELLCRKYWYPIYAFVRRRGFDSHAAEDLTQAFFAHLLENETLKHLDRQKGKFRSFLLAVLTNFLNNEWDKKQTLKRGGHRQIISLDETEAEDRYRQEPSDPVATELLFDRQWALTLLDQVLARLKQEYTTGGKADLFSKLEPFITGEVTPGLYAELGLALGMKLETVRMALSRLRRRFGEMLRNEIVHTVTSPEEVEAEIRHLFAAIST
jgi:RNA polymerase sigma-70 factor (ECF subfamily)